MFKKILIGALLAGTVATAQAASATVIDFEDLTSYGNLVDGYAGINWNNNFSYYGDPQSPYNPASGSFRIYSNYDVHASGQQDSLIFNFTGPVSFQGLYAAGAGNGTVSYDMYLGGNLVGSSVSIVTNGTPTFIGNSYAGMTDEVRINAINGYSVYDDITFNAGAVPEPASWAMMIGGFGIAGAAMRRRVAKVAFA